MIITDVGQVAPDFHLIGHPAVPVYLCTSPKPVIFDAGFSCMAGLYEAGLRSLLGQAQPRLLCMTHSHFDHVGAAGHLLKAFPGLTTAASAKTAEVMQKPGARELIASLNDAATQQVRRLWGGAGDDGFIPFDVEMVLTDGQVIDLGGGQTMEVLATPGHTWDMLSYYLPQQKVLVASEAAGCAASDGSIVTEFLVDYDTYLASLERLASLEVDVLCQAHIFVYTGDDARKFFQRSIKAAKEFRRWVLRLLDEEHGSVERVVARVKATEYDPMPQPKQPEPAYLLNLTARVRHLKQTMSAA